jgi:hypothetical protein
MILSPIHNVRGMLSLKLFIVKLSEAPFSCLVVILDFLLRRIVSLVNDLTKCDKLRIVYFDKVTTLGIVCVSSLEYLFTLSRLIDILMWLPTIGIWDTPRPVIKCGLH